MARLGRGQRAPAIVAAGAAAAIDPIVPVANRYVLIVLHLDYATRTSAPDRAALIVANTLDTMIVANTLTAPIVANTLRAGITANTLAAAITGHHVTAQITPSVKSVIIADAV